MITLLVKGSRRKTKLKTQHMSVTHSMSLNSYIDNGAQSTLIRRDIATSLGLTDKRKEIKIDSIKDKGEVISTQEVTVAVESIDGRNVFQVKSAYVVPKSKFYVPSQHLPIDFKHNLRYSYLSHLNLRNIKAPDITVLLGANIPEALIQSDVRIGSENNRTAVLTPFEWTLL